MIKLVAPFSSTGGSVVSVNGKMGVVVLTPEDIGALREGALEGYATEQYVQDQIKDIDIPETDLTGYATESYVQEKIAEAELGGSGEVDLSAYATKQYVSEQINAVELMPGPTGPAGPKGNDGYTPVKGVDYFDGAPGAAGKDGYTPVKGVDYFDGKDGAPGKDGKDYVLTDADKQEIAGMVEVTGGGGEGGSVNIDNETIISEDGVIKTAVGGSMSMADKEQVYYWGNENGAEGDFQGRVYFDTRMANLDETMTAIENGELDVYCKIAIASSLGSEILERECTINTMSRSDSKWRVIFDVPDCSFQPQLYVDFRFDADYYTTTSVLYSFELYLPEQVVYTPIRNEFIDAEYFATRDYVAELIGGIENGSY